jgi:F-type H+-transporting ATPase subunit b
MFASAEFWVAVALAIVLGLGAWKGLRPTLAKLDERAERIRRDLDEAQSLREEAQRQLAEYKRKQRDALKTAEEILEHARSEAKRLSAEAERNLEETQKRREQQAMDKIAQAEANAVLEVRAAAVDLAVAATAKLLQEKLDANTAKQMLDEQIEGLPKALN